MTSPALDRTDLDSSLAEVFHIQCEACLGALCGAAVEGRPADPGDVPCPMCHDIYYRPTFQCGSCGRTLSHH